MFCDQHFYSFNESLKLDETRRARIETAISAFRSFCIADPQLRAAAAEPPFLQGSVATNTAIRPLVGDEFDVDIIYPFRLAAFSPQCPPQHIINWFLSRLRENPFYAEHLIPKERCARIDYAGDFHIDIIPSTTELPNHQPYAVPARDVKGWVTNNPIGFASWVKERDVRGGGRDIAGEGYFVRSIRMMKRWRDQYFDAESAPSSMLLVTLLGKHDPAIREYTPPLAEPLFPDHQTHGAYLYDMLRLTHGCLMDGRPESSCNPSVPGEDLGAAWRSRHLNEFLGRLGHCIEHLRQGLWADSEAQSIASFKRAFGDTFADR